MPPLAIAAQRRHHEIVRLFLSHGADVNQTFQYGIGFNDITKSALHIAVEIPDNVEVVRSLLESNQIDVNATDEKGMTPLYIAARRLSQKYVKLLCDAGAKVNTTPNGVSLLTAVAQWTYTVRSSFSKGQTESDLVETMDFLLSLADPAVPEANRLKIFTRDNQTLDSILHSAANTNNLAKYYADILKLADRLDPPSPTFVSIPQGVELSSTALEGAGGAAKLLLARNRKGWTPLHASLSQREPFATTAALLSYDTRVPFINIPDRKGMTPLQASMTARAYEDTPPEVPGSYTQRLIDAGADVGTTDCEGHSPISYALRMSIEYARDYPDSLLEKVKEKVSGLLDAGADINTVDACNGESLGHIVIRECVLEKDALDLLCYLFAEGLDPETQDKQGFSLVHRAAEKGFACLIEFFAGRWNVHAKTGKGDQNSSKEQTVAHLLQSQDPRTAISHVPNPFEVLKRIGCDLDALNADGNTALHHAIEKSEIECVRLLLKAGSDAQLKTKNGETALEFAERRKRERTLDLSPVSFRRGGGDFGGGGSVGGFRGVGLLGARVGGGAGGFGSGGSGQQGGGFGRGFGQRGGTTQFTFPQKIRIDEIIEILKETESHC